MAPLLLVTHMGLGDMIICNGLVRFLASSRRQVVVACKIVNIVNVKYMFRDLDNVHLLPVEGDECISPRFGANPQVLQAFRAVGWEVMLLGLHRGYLPPGSGFADALYMQAGICKSVRYSHFHVERDHVMESKYKKQGAYRFVHDDTSRSFEISLDGSDLPVFHPGQADDEGSTNNIFSFLGVMECASRLDAIDSCFAWLADLLDICPGRRYMHANVKNPADKVESLYLRPGWVFVR